MNFANKIIELWMIIYDQDYDRIYTFSDFNQVLRSIDVSIRGYLCDDPVCDDVCSRILQSTAKLKGHQCVIPIVVDKLQIMVYRWELDKTTKVHKLLAECHGHVPDKLQSEITDLFTDIA